MFGQLYLKSSIRLTVRNRIGQCSGKIQARPPRNINLPFIYMSAAKGNSCKAPFTVGKYVPRRWTGNQLIRPIEWAYSCPEPNVVKWLSGIRREKYPLARPALERVEEELEVVLSFSKASAS